MREKFGFQTSDPRSRGQGSTLLIVIVVTVILVLVTLSATVLSGFVDTPMTESNEPTPEPMTPAATSTRSLTSTPTTISNLTPTLVPTLTPTTTPTATSTPQPTPTPTVTPTATPEGNTYKVFKGTMFVELQEKPTVPIRVRGWTIVDSKLYIVVNLTSNSEDGLRRLREQNGILTAYAQTLLFYDQGKISGKAPTGMRILEVNNTNSAPKTTFANNSVVRKWSSNQISTVEFHSQVYSTTRNQTVAERRGVRSVDRSAKNYTFYNGTARPTDE